MSHTTRRLALFAAGFAIAFFTTSCSQDPTSAVQALLTQRVAEQSGGYLKLTNFLKRDAVLQKINGVDNYHVKYSVEAEGVKDGGFLYMCESNGPDGLVMGFHVSNAYNKGNCFVFPVKAGKHYKFDETGFPTSQDTHEMTLVKHESGWVIEER